jgi:TusA-related sulfurtransferase
MGNNLKVDSELDCIGFFYAKPSSLVMEVMKYINYGHVVKVKLDNPKDGEAIIQWVKETGYEKEKHLVSAVFHNRLRKKMKLQSDPTSVYDLESFTGGVKKKHLMNYSMAAGPQSQGNPFR